LRPIVKSSPGWLQPDPAGKSAWLSATSAYGATISDTPSKAQRRMKDSGKVDGQVNLRLEKASCRSISVCGISRCAEFRELASWIFHGCRVGNEVKMPRLHFSVNRPEQTPVLKRLPSFAHGRFTVRRFAAGQITRAPNQTSIYPVRQQLRSVKSVAWIRELAIRGRCC
jgi:hypothetical protein